MTTLPAFWLGTHMPNWLAVTSIPLFIARQRLENRRTLPRALGSWALDSGAFTELSKHGAWTVTPARYAALVRRFRDETGQLAWAAPQDWMCEPFILDKTGGTVAGHQAATVANYLELRSLAPELPFIPVLQGWTRDDYLRCAGRYETAGVDLAAQPLVGLGSVCRRQGTRDAAVIVRALEPLRLHGFGIKTTGLVAYGYALASADSLAWSYNARRHPPLPGCPHRTCANCLKWALRWHDRLLASLAAADARGHQLELPAALSEQETP